MTFLRRWSIRRRIILVGLVPVFIAVATLTSYHMSQRWDEIRRETESVSSMVLQHLAIAAEYPVISGNVALLEPMILAALAQPSIVAVDVLGPDRNVLYSKKIERYQEVPNADIHELYHDVIQEIAPLDVFSEFGGASPIPSRRHLATIRIEVADTFSHERQEVTLRQSLIAGLAVISLSLVIGLAISTTIIPPLEKLSAFIAGLARGDTSQRIKVEDGAEIGSLQHNINRLASFLENARQQDQEYTNRLKEEREKTEAASRAKSQFLAMMSHELRTPLNGANGTMQLIRQDSSTDEFEELRNMALTSLMHLNQILEDVLVIVDVEKGKLPVAPQDQRLPDVLIGLLNEFRGKALEKRLSFVVEYAPALVRQKIGVDPSLVRQVVRHIVDNAMKFTDQGYVIVAIDLVKHGAQSRLRIVVTDTGIGIPDDKRELIFEAFSQVSSSFNRRYDGIGLGLTITHHVIHVLGGRISLDDTPGGGTVVHVELPATVVEQSVGSISHNNGQQQSVLIVEDNPVNLKVAQRMMSKVMPELKIDSVESGEACLEQIAKVSYDMILMDCQMPGLDGFETTRQLREMAITVPIIACTANTSDEVYERCFDSGMNGFIGKPLQFATLKAELKKWLMLAPANDAAQEPEQS